MLAHHSKISSENTDGAQDTTTKFADAVKRSADERKQDVGEAVNKSKVGGLQRDGRKMLRGEEELSQREMQAWDERLQGSGDIDKDETR